MHLIRQFNSAHVKCDVYSEFQLTLAARVWKHVRNLGTTFQNSRFHCYRSQSNCEPGLSPDFYFAKYRFSFRKVQISFCFAKYNKPLEFACAEIGFGLGKLHGKHRPLIYIVPNVDLNGYGYAV